MGISATLFGLWQEIESGRLHIRAGGGKPPVAGGQAGDAHPSAPSLVTGDHVFLCDCSTDRGASLRFIDLANWIALDLPEIATALGIELAPLPGDLGEDADWDRYLSKRLETIRGAVDHITGMVSKYDLGNMRWTLGGQAMSHFRHRHLKTDIVAGPDPAIRPLERKGYYGARAEVYFRGKVVAEGTEAFVRPLRDNAGTPICVSRSVIRLDCNACYPFVMSRNRFPTRLFRRCAGMRVIDLAHALESFEGVACLRLLSPHEPYPQRRHGRTRWVVGEIDTVLCGPELRRAVESGHVVRLDYVQLYHAEPIFAEWFVQLMRWRKNTEQFGDTLSRRIFKRMMNSLHGKFGQSGKYWETVPGKIPQEHWGEYVVKDQRTGQLSRCRGVNGLLQILRTDEDAAGACPIIAACVTSHAREHMRAARLIAGDRNTYYEDADSLHVSANGLTRLLLHGLVDDNRPGAFKVEGEVSSAEYRGVKNYRFGDTEVIAGHALAGGYNASGVWQQTEWASMDSLLSRGCPSRPISVVREKEPVVSFFAGGYDRAGWFHPLPAEL